MQTNNLQKYSLGGGEEKLSHENKSSQQCGKGSLFHWFSGRQGTETQARMHTHTHIYTVFYFFKL